MIKSFKPRGIRTGAALLICLILYSACTGDKKSLEGSTGPASINSTLNETAMFLAGREIPATSPLYSATGGNWYRMYSDDISQAWNKFQKPNLEKMAAWWKNNRPSGRYGTVFYPFSGPDIMNALTLFPEADLYILFGLEHPGRIPDAIAMTPNERHRGLVGIRRSLGTILNVNFFRTLGMAEDLGTASFNSITGILFFFLSINDYTIVDARRIAVDSSGALVEGIPADDKYDWQKPVKNGRIPGIEIIFRKDKGRIQKLRYFNLNIIDYALSTYTPQFIPYMERRAPFVTVIKSASYTMHNDRFTMIRGAILSGSEYIVEDDSGIPIRYLEGDNWNVKYHGYFNVPVPLFNKSNLRQPDLKEAVGKYSSGELPFSYGYNVKRSVLITAERKK